MPAHIAALPSTAPVYALRYDALSRQTLHAIVDRFPSFRAARPQSEVVGGRTMLVYTHGTERLGVVLSTDTFEGPFPPPQVIQDFWTGVYAALDD